MSKTEVEVSPQGVPVARAIPLRGQLKMLADHMTRSHHDYAALHHLSEVDATEFVQFRHRLVTKIQELGGVQVSFTHLIVKIVAQCLREHPLLNSTLVKDRILLLDDVNVGIAVALENGMLIVPVIKHADRKPITEIAREAHDIADRARKNRLTLDDVTGGTFTVTNFGMFAHKSATGAGLWSTPLITVPQSAILGLGNLYQKAAVRNGEIVARTMLPTSLTVDRRVINGIPAAQFMNSFYRLIEEPDRVDWGI